MRFTQFFNYLAVGSLAGIAAAAPLGTRTLEVEEGEQLASRSTNAVVSVSALAVTSVNDSVGKSSGSNSYTKYTGDGSTADGWPAKSDWLSFDAMWEANKEAVIAKSCSNNGWGQDNSATETANIKSAIEKVAKESKVDHRFILAVVLQESKGCVRVPTTANSVSNPGLMQSFQGTGTCYGKSTCSDSEIVQMIRDGAIGTSSSGGYGLASYLDLADRTGVAAYYRAARLYNSGVNSLKSTTNLDLASGATSCYASDIANRLTGWTTATSKCSSCDPLSSGRQSPAAEQTTTTSYFSYCRTWHFYHVHGCVFHSFNIMIPGMEKSGCREKPAHGIAPVAGFPQTRGDGYQNTFQPSTDLSGWKCLADVTMWKCTLLECVASMMYTFMLTWVTIAPASKDRVDIGNLSYLRTDIYDWVRFLPASIVNMCLLPLIIVTFTRSSGGYVNPTITLAAYFLHRMSLSRAAMYIAGQVVGGALAVWAVQEACGSTEFDMGCIISLEGVSIRDAYIAEIIGSFAIVVTVMYVTAGRRSRGLFGDAMLPWMVGIAIEAGFWLPRVIWQEYPRASRSLWPALWDIMIQGGC
ncbi:hypothetical protein BO79DRAFT_234440 [Aspergillus costaricaensis CBS 115574]|uniref:Uncharacterized protein n=1 Tax=Aspergillus costaricaensis CBS 115574 TaxID=1448317 RepID=A0ACD1IST8_9EURO|nr:hypothetical protein BO79DRAFT_234440 [Aspergillus costaricaensis CBS 115574]RAK93394.1 hypothetical protein BO79DRAFT_234440 [Aspergillus costaricaensis CBS 115574]